MTVPYLTIQQLSATLFVIAIDYKTITAIELLNLPLRSEEK